MSAKEPRRVQLTGEERERVTQLRKEVERALFEMTEIGYVTGKCVYVLGDPPGVCSECGPGDDA